MSPRGKRVAAVICNWNKKDYLLGCLESVIGQTLRAHPPAQSGNFIKSDVLTELDVFVVDNASTDGSAESVANTYGDSVTLIRNAVNRGGAGGFNDGIREALRSNRDYDYLVLLDNDVQLDSRAIDELVNFMESTHNAAMAGSKIYSMSNPGTLQEFGAGLDWEHATIAPHKKGYSETVHGALVANIETDYVPACASIVRRSAIEKCGAMEESYFIYWDDIEWAWRMRRFGYSIFVVASSLVWHHMGTSNKKNLAPTYYFWRNRVRFFKKYGGRTSMYALFLDAYTALFTCGVFEKTNTSAILSQALADGLNDVGGRRDFEDGMVLNLDTPKNFLAIYAEEDLPKLNYVNVGHVILDASTLDVPGRLDVYTDRYGNVLPALQAIAFKADFDKHREEYINVTLNKCGFK
ncbi:MAG: glycosyltransferase family 2 protein [Nitrospirae bacterium]|nr:glycosyltransferase family 2 protein [Nitrospirota bacterium]